MHGGEDLVQGMAGVAVLIDTVDDFYGYPITRFVKAAQSSAGTHATFQELTQPRRPAANRPSAPSGDEIQTDLPLSLS